MFSIWPVLRLLNSSVCPLCMLSLLKSVYCKHQEVDYVIHYTVTIQLSCQPQISVSQWWNAGYQDPEFLGAAHSQALPKMNCYSIFLCTISYDLGSALKEKAGAPTWAKLTMSVINKRPILCCVGHTASMGLAQALTGVCDLWKAPQQCRWATELNSNAVPELCFTFCMKWLQSMFTQPFYR